MAETHKMGKGNDDQDSVWCLSLVFTDRKPIYLHSKDWKTRSKTNSEINDMIGYDDLRTKFGNMQQKYNFNYGILKNCLTNTNVEYWTLDGKTEPYKPPEERKLNKDAYPKNSITGASLRFYAANLTDNKKTLWSVYDINPDTAEIEPRTGVHNFIEFYLKKRNEALLAASKPPITSVAVYSNENGKLVGRIRYKVDFNVVEGKSILNHTYWKECYTYPIIF
jgi:hypothetical protein